ncbi:MAG: hypothetical protein LBU65_01890 [Planctomycetaceae bacterium]|jgi:hypothetical protein|nr:hypothetical protein [Planctomycetaceae bacterium]
MLTKLIARIDAISERLSPIVVWEFRRNFRRNNMGVVWLIFTSLIIFAAIVCLFYADTIEKNITSAILDVKTSTGRNFLMAIVIPFVSPLAGACVGAIIGAIIAPSISIINWSYNKVKFPDYHMAVTREQIYDGYYQFMVIQLCRLYSFIFCAAMFVYSFRIISLEIILYLLVLLIILAVLANIIYTIACCCNTNRYQIVLRLVVSAIVFVTSISLMIILATGFIVISSSSMINQQTLTIERWLPLLIVAVITYLYVCKRLHKYNRNTKRSDWIKLFVTMSTFFMLTAIIAGAGFVNYWYFGL